jgi:hypothetical protein
MIRNATRSATPFQGSVRDTPTRPGGPWACNNANQSKITGQTNCRQDHHWTDDLPARLARHQAGDGARLVAVITAAGIGFTLARTVTGDRRKERAIKNAGGATRYCPVCSLRPWTGKWTADEAAGPWPAGPDPGPGAGL